MPNRPAVPVLPTPIASVTAQAMPAAPHLRREVQRSRQVFVNRNLKLEKIEMIGFDMDYTLAVYEKRLSEELAYDMTLARLVLERGYPADIGAIRYEPSFVMRGLVIDKEHGNILKVDRYNHVGRCYHGRRLLSADERRALYGQERLRLGSPRYAWIDTLFALPEACLYACIVDLLESTDRSVSYQQLYDDIRATIDAVHRDGSLKAELRKELPRYIGRDADLGPTLHKLRSAGKKLFLATNSHWDYTDAVMKHLLDGALAEYPHWTRYFDHILVGTQKPHFFSEGHPFLELDGEGNVLGETRVPERGRVYQGGNLTDFEAATGIGGDRVLYVGDHIYGDILRSRKHSLWRTCLIVEELEEEIAHLQRHAEALRSLRACEHERQEAEDELNHHKLAAATLERRMERADDPSTLEEPFRAAKAEIERVRRRRRQLDEEIDRLEQAIEHGANPHWGLLFKEGSENSRFGEQVENFACIYTGRVTNLLAYSPMQYFRSPREVMPHEQD